MCVICPTVTATSAHDYRSEMERIQDFAERIHIDVSDKDFTGVDSVKLDQVWWPKEAQVDLHVMYKDPTAYLPKILKMQPSLVIFHAEAEGNLPAFLSTLQRAGIKVGVAFLQDTPVNDHYDLVSMSDHALIFSGKLGHHGGVTDLRLLSKVTDLKAINPAIEVSWDGGISADNAAVLKEGGVEVLNVGGYIQRADSPEHNYTKLVELIDE